MTIRTRLEDFPNMIPKPLHSRTPSTTTNNSHPINRGLLLHPVFASATTYLLLITLLFGLVKIQPFAVLIPYYGRTSSSDIPRFHDILTLDSKKTHLFWMIVSSQVNLNSWLGYIFHSVSWNFISPSLVTRTSLSPCYVFIISPVWLVTVYYIMYNYDIM